MPPPWQLLGAPFLNKTIFLVAVSQSRETDSDVIERVQKEKTVAALAGSLPKCTINNSATGP